MGKIVQVSYPGVYIQEATAAHKAESAPEQLGAAETPIVEAEKARNVDLQAAEQALALSVGLLLGGKQRSPRAIQTPEGEAMDEDPLTATPEGEAMDEDPLTATPEGEAMDEDPLTATPEGEAMDEDPLTATPEGEAMDEDPLTATPEGEAMDEDPLMATPEGEAMDEDPLMATPEGEAMDEDPLMATPEGEAMDEDPLMATPEGEAMDEDPLMADVDASGINGRVYEALQRGDFQSLIWGILSETNPDSPLATLLRFMLAENHGLSSGTAGQNDGNGQLAAVRATLRRVAGTLGACSTCFGEESSCPECHGSGKPGSAPSSMASAEELGAWLGGL